MLKKLKSYLIKMKWYMISFAFALLLAASCGFITYIGAFDELDSLLTDTIYKQIDFGNDDTPIRIIAIDEKTVEALGEFDTWSRSISADVVDILNSGEENPVIIGMDLMYDEEKDESGDAAFVEACEDAGNVCLIAKKNIAMPGEIKPGEEPPEKPSGKSDEPSEKPGETEITYPYEKLRQVAQVGVADSFDGGNGDAIREITLHTETGETKLDSFAVVLYKAYQQHAGKSYQLESVVSDNQVRFNYSRPSSDYTTYSFIDVLNRKVDVSEFANTIVIIGDYTEEDTKHIVPNQQGGKMQDAGLQANALEAMLSKKLVFTFPSEILAVIYACMIFLFYYLIFFVKKKRSIPMTIVFLVVHFDLGYFLSSNNFYLPILPLWVFSVLAVITGLFIGYLREKENKKNLQKALEAYVESDIVEQILENNSFDIKLGTQKRDIAVLFVDIRGFTTISESLQPEQIVDILNEYLELAARAVMKNEGNIDKFIGDAAMAIYNAPKDLEDYVLKAVYTAWDIKKGANQLKENCLQKYGKEVNFGIGVHCGPAVVGNIGCECRMDYTAIGDTVNTASRLEANAKAGQILISSDVYEIVKGFVKAEPIGKLALKGKTKEIETYQVNGIIRKDGLA